MSTLDDFLDGRVQADDNGCLNWRLYRTPRGYGRVRHNGRAGLLAHRVAYELVHGPIPDGLTVHHRCFNPSCVNVEHLELLTHAANTALQRSALATHCSHGHEFTDANTYHRTPASRGQRTCRTCNADAAHRYNQRSTAA